MLFVWSQFALCVALIWFAGVRLSRCGDVIAEKAHLSRTWVGVILLATVTSLPELVTGISAVALVGDPNIAMGDILGSCVFNLMIITVLDFLNREESVFTRASQGHILSAGFGVILIGFVGFNLLLRQHGITGAIGHIGVSSPIIVAMYLIAMRTVFRYERQQRAAYTEEAVERYADVTLRQAVAGYATAAVVVVATGVALPFVANQIATVMAWQRTFVATLFVAFATSVPEMAVSIAALRMDALDMAIGNLFGSNLFNIAIVAVDDVFYLPGPILAHASPLNAVSSLSAVMMTGIAIVGLLYRPKTRLFQIVGWTGFWLFSFYLLNAYLLYLYAE
jgi:cation:H+ antiporter